MKRPLLSLPIIHHRWVVLVKLSRRIGTVVLVLFVGGGLCALQADSWKVKRQGAHISGRVHPDLPKGGDDVAPNLHHIWGSHVPGLFLDAPALNVFGRDLVQFRDRGWKFICRLDSDSDGATNGEELGDPCCDWVPGEVLPYRRWNLSHPGFVESDEQGFLLTPGKLVDLSPASCQNSSEAMRAEAQALRSRQFERQYYMHHELDKHTSDSLRWIKYPCIAGVLLLLSDWAVHRGLVRDLFGVGPLPKGEGDIGWKRRLAIYVGAYFWTDGIAGLTHLTFDFCPQWYPIIGAVARGFQFHHFHPTAWVVVPYTVMLSHSLPLLGLLSLALATVPPRRAFRAFWTLTFALCCLTVTTHRFVHVPPGENYGWFQLLQSVGLLMSHEHHMRHHDSLVTQFSNLSGVTDGVLDYFATNWLPPTEYQHWLAICLLYFAVPIALGADARPGRWKVDDDIDCKLP